MDTANAIVLALCLLLMLGAFLGIAAIDRRALPPVMLTAALVITAGGYVAYLFAP